MLTIRIKVYLQTETLKSMMKIIALQILKIIIYIKETFKMSRIRNIHTSEQ